MTLPDTMSLMPLVQTIGWVLIHFLWQGAVVAVVFAAGMLSLRKAQPTVRYAFGLFCLALMGLAPIVTGMAIYQDAAVVLSLPAASIADQALAVHASPSASWHEFLNAAMPLLVVAWAVCVLFLAFRLTLNWLHIRYLSANGVIPLDAQLQASVRTLQARFKLTRVVRVMESTLVHVPTVFGWLRPVILLPTSTLTGLTVNQIELVIAHEMGHIRRFDYVVNLIQVAIETLLFYHPAVRWVSRRIREEREKCCDDLVVSICGQPIEYAKALAGLESLRKMVPEPALGATGGILYQRIERIVRDPSRPRRAVVGSSLVVVAIAAAIAVAGRMSDPMAALDAQREEIADHLVTELLNEQTAIAELNYLKMGPPLPDEEADTYPVRIIDAGDLAYVNRLAEIDFEQYVPVIPPVKLAVTFPEISAPTLAVPELPAAVPQVRTADLLDPVTKSQVATFGAARKPAVSNKFFQLASSNIIDGELRSQSLLPFSRGWYANLHRPTPANEAAADDLGYSDTVAAPKPLVQVEPAYPVKSQIAGKEGYITLEFNVDSRGLVTGIEIVEAQPKRVFDRAAVKALRQWRFDPDSLEHPEQRFVQRFDFNLDGRYEAPPSGNSRCQPITGTHICRMQSPTALLVQEAVID